MAKKENSLRFTDMIDMEEIISKGANTSLQQAFLLSRYLGVELSVIRNAPIHEYTASLREMGKYLENSWKIPEEENKEENNNRFDLMDMED